MNESGRQNDRLTTGQILLTIAVLSTATFLLGLIAVWVLTPPEPKPDIAAAAERYLRSRKSMSLSEPLEKIVTDRDTYFVKTLDHPLLEKPAPDFKLVNHRGEHVRLTNLFKNGPVVLVFYYGYWCDHCVAQLFGLEEDLARFRELDATIVAISADTVEQTREKFERYGEFSFPVLSDPEHRVARTFGVHLPAREDHPEVEHHGTFLISREGIVKWVDFGDQPFIHNKTLLYELARIEGRLPGIEPSADHAGGTRADRDSEGGRNE